MEKSLGLSRTRLIAYGWMLLNVVVWGAALIISKPALDYTTAFRFLLYRYALAAVCSLPLLWYYLPRIKHLRQQLVTITKLELIGTTLSLGLLYAGLARTSAIEASLLTTTLPIFITLGGVIWLKERQEKRENLGLLIAFVSTLALTFLPTINGYKTLSGISLTGNVLILAHNVMVAFYYLSAKFSYQKLPKFFVTTISFWIGLISFGFLSFIEATNAGQNLLDLIVADWSHPAVWLAAAYMAVFGSIIGLTAYIKGQNLIEASEASLFSYLQPLVYLPLGVIWLKEPVSVTQLLALGGILVGVVIAEWRFGKAGKSSH